MAKRFAISIINRDTNQLEIMEQGITFFEDIRDLMNDLKEEGRSLTDVDLKVKRRGTGKDDTTYRVDIDAKIPLTDADKEMIKGKRDLDEYFKPNPPEQILKLLNVKADSPQGYLDAWVEIMTEGTDDNKEEEIEVK